MAALENWTKRIRLSICLLWLASSVVAQNYPNLILTQEGVAEIRKSDYSNGLFEKTLKEAQTIVDEQLLLGPQVPVPKDMAGGYTHERHKLNFFVLQMAGNLFQITEEEKYAEYIRSVLLAYAELYPTLPIHPTNRSYSTGKLFWQCLNDANWLVYVSQAYDCVYNYLSPEDRALIEKDLLRPFADFISLENPRFFNRIHNHSTWGNAAVGMLGLVLEDEELINRALYGLEHQEINAQAKDNDGGLIILPGQKKAGFLAQLDNAFSPDGYYTEGPYYQRYAISPFIFFAKALANKRPDLKIFDYRDQLLEKAVYALLYQSDFRGQFFPINDAQKGMSLRSRELIAAVNSIYDYVNPDPRLLAIAALQNKVELDQSGFKISQALKSEEKPVFNRPSIELRDGKDGTEGALGILRQGNAEQELCLAFKYTAQGLGHGHYDKLSYSLYDDQQEVIQDYGAARWVNIDQKAGGRYLPENKTWAKQTIGHNTLVKNKTSHFQATFEVANANHSEGYFFDVSDPNFQVSSAKDHQAYPGTTMHRTMALLQDEAFEYPLVIDIMRAQSPAKADFDLPLWFQGHLLSCNLPYESALNKRTTLGTDFGYEHLWLEAKGETEAKGLQISWFKEGRFYTHTANTEAQDSFLFARLGANDPNFNLRPDQTMILRKTGRENPIFASVLETHGSYNPVDEIPLNPYGKIKSVEVVLNETDYSVITIHTDLGWQWQLAISNTDESETSEHQVTIGSKKISWKGPHDLKKISN